MPRGEPGIPRGPTRAWLSELLYQANELVLSAVLGLSQETGNLRIVHRFR